MFEIVPTQKNFCVQSNLLNMKTVSRLTTLIFVFLSFYSHAQQLEHRSVLAHYPFTSDLNDATGNHGPAEVINAPIQGAEGIYSNGNYIGSDPDSCQVRTPNIASIDTSDLAVSIEFKITEIPNQGMPIFILGESWRWLGANVGFSGELELVHADAASTTGSAISLNTWYTAVVTYDGASSTFKAYLNGNEVHSVTGNHQAPASDKRISNTHGGVGQTFKGNFRNLKVYGKVAVGIERNQQIVFNLVHLPQNETVKVHSTESLKNVDFKIYATNGKTIDAQELPVSGLINIASLPVGTHVVALYRDNQVIGMKKLIII